MKDILIIGGGKIGETIARFLAATPDYALTVADRLRDALGAAARSRNATARQASYR